RGEGASVEHHVHDAEEVAAALHHVGRDTQGAGGGGRGAEPKRIGDDAQEQVAGGVGVDRPAQLVERHGYLLGAGGGVRVQQLEVAVLQIGRVVVQVEHLHAVLAGEGVLVGLVETPGTRRVADVQAGYMGGRRTG